MTTAIPDLWPVDVRVDVLTPLAILRTQEATLRRRTQGVLEAQVLSSATDDSMFHQLDVSLRLWVTEPPWWLPNIDGRVLTL